MEINRAATADAASIDASASIREAAEKMRSANIGFLVVSEHNELVGVVTDRDIVIRTVATGTSLQQSTTVRDAMSYPVVTISGFEDLSNAADLMREKQIRRLVVVNDQQEPTGVLSLDDLASSTHGDETAGRILEDLTHNSQSAEFSPSENIEWEVTA